MVFDLSSAAFSAMEWPLENIPAIGRERSDGRKNDRFEIMGQDS